MKKDGVSSSEDEEMEEEPGSQPEADAGGDITMISKSTAKSGGRKIPVQWSRVISLDHIKDGGINGFSVEEDMEYEPEISEAKSRRRKKQWEPLFFPKEFWKNHPFHQIDQNELSVKALKSLGKSIT